MNLQSTQFSRGRSNVRIRPSAVGPSAALTGQEIPWRLTDCIGEQHVTENTGPNTGESPSRLIDARIAELADWRGETLARLRSLIKQADSDVIEEWKWRGGPVWSHAGIICTGETYKAVVKLTFAKGASLEDLSGLFNSSLDGNTRRAIDLREGEEIDEDAFKALIRAAVALNEASARAPKKRAAGA
jgi:hypothetical protein